MTFNIKKGDKAFTVSFSHELVCHVWVKEIEIMSWGKRQGTGVSVENGKCIRHQLYLAPNVHNFRIAGVDWIHRVPTVVRSREDVEALAAVIAPRMSASAIEGSLRRNRSWMVRYGLRANPGVADRCQAKIAELEAAKPSYKINWH